MAMNISERRAAASRETVMKICDRRAERAETVMNIHERRAVASRYTVMNNWNGERKWAAKPWWRLVTGEQIEPERWWILTSGERHRAAARWWLNEAVVKIHGWRAEGKPRNGGDDVWPASGASRNGDKYSRAASGIEPLHGDEWVKRWWRFTGGVRKRAAKRWWWCVTGGRSEPKRWWTFEMGERSGPKRCWLSWLWLWLWLWIWLWLSLWL